MTWCRGNDQLVNHDNGAYDAKLDSFASDIPFTGTAFLRNRATAKKTTTAGKSTGTRKVPKCGMQKRGELSRRTNADMLEDNEWWVLESESCPATMVKDGQSIAIMDISGCSGLFFFSNSGKTSAYHISAGKEASEVVAAVQSAKAAGTTDFYSIYAASPRKIKDIEGMIKSVIRDIKEAGTGTYALNTQDRLQRFKMLNKPGSRAVAVTEYSCE